MIKYDSIATGKLIGRTPSRSIIYEVLEQPDVNEGSRAELVQKDIVYDVITSSSIKNNAIIVVSNIDIEEQQDLIITTNNANATIDGNKIVWAADGDVTIQVKHYLYGTVEFTRTMLNTSGTENDLTGYSIDSLAKHIYDSTMALISGKTYSKEITKYIIDNNNEPSAPSVTLNPDVFTGSLDFSGTSVMTTLAGGSVANSSLYPLTLVTQRHALVATHVDGNVGDTVVFKRVDGTYQTVTILNITLVTGAQDLSVVYLSADVTGTSVYKTLQPDWADLYSVYSDTVPFNAMFLPVFPSVPMLARRTHFSDGTGYTENGTPLEATIQIVPFAQISQNIFTGELIGEMHYFRTDYTLTANYSEWGTERAIGGDSGGSNFFLINGELVFVSSNHTTIGASNISFYTTVINEIMNTQAGTTGVYALTHPDISVFTNYI